MRPPHNAAENEVVTVEIASTYLSFNEAAA